MTRSDATSHVLAGTGWQAPIPMSHTISCFLRPRAQSGAKCPLPPPPVGKHAESSQHYSKHLYDFCTMGELTVV